MGEKKAKKDGGGEKEKGEEPSGITVVLKTEMHCEGCATKIQKCAKNIEGVEKAKAEWEANKLTVKGEVDPSELREELQERLKKKVELISPQLSKKDKDAGGDKGGGDSKKSTDDKTKNKKEDNNNNKNSSSKDVKKSDDKKPKEKEAPVTTAVLKLSLHCGGCIDKIHKIASKTKGVESIKVDREKELVTVTGTMDAKALAESLEEKMKRSVQIIPPKKDKDGEGGGEGKDGGGGNKKDKKKGGGGGGGDEAETAMVGGNRMEYVGLPMPNCGSMYGPVAGFGPGYGYPQPYPCPYPYPYGNNLHAPQIFSDENPNACSVM